MPNVDSLNISISATAQKASGALDTLIGKLGHLQTSISSINTGGLNNMAHGINAVSSAMGSLKNVNAADFNRLAKGIQKLGSIDAATITRAAGSINLLGNSIGKVSNANFSGTTQIADLAKAIAQLGYKSSTQAIDNIPKLAVAMNQLITSLSKAPQVSQNVIDLTNALAKLARTGASSGRAVDSLTRVMNPFSSATKKARTSAFSLASAIGKVYATYWLLFRAFGKIKEAMDISSQLTEVQNVVNTTFGEYSRLLDEMSKTSITEFGISELSVKKTASNFQAMGTAMGFTRGKMADMSIELTKLSADMASFYNVSQEEVAEDLQSVFTGMTRPLRQYGLDLTEATLKEWALKNGMDANIKSMSQAEKTMLRYQYVMSNTGAAQGDFARTSMTWANQTRILVENFKALGSIIGGTFINVFKPLVVALNEVMATLIAFAETVSNSLGKIFGWQYEAGGTGGMTSDFEDAEISAGGIEDSTGKTADNVEKIKKGLRAFDELKTISIDTGSKGGGSGSGGAGGGASADGSGGQWVRTESIFEDYESTLDSLYKLGEYIGTTLTDALNSINWDNVYKGAEGFGSGLASFLNGLISPELFGSVGKTIAGSLNTAIKVALSFAETFDFEGFGDSISKGITEFFREFNAEDFANAIDAWVQGLWTAFKTIVSNKEMWKEAISDVKDFITNLDVETITLLVTGGIAIKFAKKITSTMILGALSSALTKAMGSTAVISAAVTAGKLGLIVAAMLTLAAGIKWAFGIESPEDPTKEAQDVVNKMAEVEMAVPISQSMEPVIDKLKEGWERVKLWWENVGKLAIEIVVDSIKEKIRQKWQEGKKWFENNVVLPIIESPLVTDFIPKLSEAWNKATGWWDKDKTPLENITAQVENIKSKVEVEWKKTKEWWANKQPLEKIKTTIENLKEKISTAWTNAKTWWNEKKSDLSKVKFTLPDLKKMLSDAWKKAREWWNNNVKLKIPKLNFKVTYTTPTSALKKAIVNALNLQGWPSLGFYASGGFPEDGTFRASHGEIMGRFDNGKSVVANNKQITDGISAAVYQGNRENNNLLREQIKQLERQNELLSAILAKEGLSKDVLFESVRQSEREYRRMTGTRVFI